MLRTTNEDETAALLLTLQKTIVASAAGAKPLDLRSLPRKTSSSVFLRHLCCTQGISQPRATKIQTMYQSLIQLLACVQNDANGTVESIGKLIGSTKIAARLVQDLGHDVDIPAPKRQKKPSPQDHASSSINSSSGVSS